MVQIVVHIIKSDVSKVEGTIIVKMHQLGAKDSGKKKIPILIVMMTTRGGLDVRGSAYRIAIKLRIRAKRCVQLKRMIEKALWIQEVNLSNAMFFVIGLVCQFKEV